MAYKALHSPNNEKECYTKQKYRIDQCHDRGRLRMALRVLAYADGQEAESYGY